MCAGRLSRPVCLPSSILNPNFVAITTLIADGREGLADEFLVRERPVRFGGIEERDARVHRLTDQCDAVLPIGGCP